jgi:hypothetical protein
VTTARRRLNGWFLAACFFGAAVYYFSGLLAVAAWGWVVSP